MAQTFLREEKTRQAYPTTQLSQREWDMINELGSYVTLCVSNKCNMNCAVCFMKDQEGAHPFEELSLEDIRFVMSKIGLHKKILLFGGEPTLRLDLPEIIKIVKDSGNLPMLFTNGVRLADEAYTRRLAAAGLTKVLLSLPSLREETTSLLCGSGEYLPLKLQALDRLKESGQTVWITSMIAKGVNDDEIASLLDLAVSDKTNSIRGIYFQAAGYGNASFSRLSPETAATQAHIIHKIEEATKGTLTAAHFWESNRLRRNLNALVKKFGGRFPLSPNRILVKKQEDGTISSFLPLDEMRRMNESLEGGRWFNVLGYAWRYRRWAGFLKKASGLPLVEFEAYKNDILFLDVSLITWDTTPLDLAARFVAPQIAKARTGELVIVGVYQA